MRIGLLLLPAVLVTGASAAIPRDSPADYPVHSDSPAATIAVDYLVHSIPTEEGMLLAGRYLVVEVGIFPREHQDVALSNSRFHLLVNGKTLEPENPGMVAGSLKYSDWEGQRSVTGQAGPVIIGPGAPAGRFPNDPSTPRPVPQPIPDGNSTGMEQQHLTVDELLTHAALPEVSVDKPVDGCLFFHYEGRTSKIHTLQLVWDGTDSERVILKLK